MKKTSRILAVGAAALLLAFGQTARATMIDTHFGLGVPIDGYGGTQIPVDQSSVTTITMNNGDVITLGLSITQHGASSPAIVNDGAGKFYPTAGLAADGKATWNVDFYIGVSSGNFSPYTFSLTYGPEWGSFASFDPSLIPDNKLTGTTGKGNSETLSFLFLSIPIGGFDPNANLIYDFQLAALENGIGQGKASAQAYVGGSVPDSGTTLSLLSASVGGLAFIRRRYIKS